MLGRERSPALPDIATAQEQGLNGIVAYGWNAIFLPKATPAPIVDKLNAAINDVLKRPDVVKLWADQGATPLPMTPAEFDKYLRGDIVKWSNVVKQFADKP